ncbi:MAG TPA: carboxymuconolactone decarboxylase family protein [Flavobacteriales bacterium]|nr:carboxymuconolactone decarboxylase family protein [Flavobacteriales bacterium]
MSYIQTNNNYPGILEMLWYKPATGRRLSALAHQLLLGKSGLTPGERETIAAYTSALNDCDFCCDSHNAAACEHLKTERKKADYLSPEFMARQSKKMQALLTIAGQVQKGGKYVQPESIAMARLTGATDEDIHDTVLITAAFCMYNRYVDGLGTRISTQEDYQETGVRLATKGYKFPPRFMYWLVRSILNKRYTKV